MAGEPWLESFTANTVGERPDPLGRDVLIDPDTRSGPVYNG